MDGNKKITGIVFAGIIALAMSACKVQPPGYVGLYVDNLISVTDTTHSGVTPLKMEDTAMAHMVDTTVVIAAELPVFLYPAEQKFKISSDSVYQHEVAKLHKAITDSFQLLRYQMIELQKQLTVMPDTVFTGEKAQKFQPPDTLQTEVVLKQLIQDKNDTITMLRNQVTKLNKSAGLKADTVYVSKELVKQPKGDSPQTDYRTTQLPQSKNDTITLLHKQVLELHNSGIIKPDTVYVIKETVKSPGAESRQADPVTSQLIKARDEQIQMLQNQLNAMQNAAARTPQPTYITSEPAQVQPLSSQQTDQLTLQLFQAQNDTIQFLRSQLQNLQLQPLKTDTVFIENEVKEMQPAKEFVPNQKTFDLQPLQDSLQLIKTRLLILEEQTLPGKDTSTLASQDVKDVPYKAITDTTLIVAFYGRGEIKPFEEASVMKQIKELSSNKNVTKITLSGYTDSSGSALINKEITNKRLNYLSEKIIPWIPKEKMFFQNFGDVFASDTMVNDERRIEIRIHTE